MTARSRRLPAAGILIAAVMTMGIATSSLAQEDAGPATISAIERGEVAGQVRLEGSALARLSDEDYMFSDGSGVIVIDIDTTDAGTDLPLFTLIGLEGTVASDEVDVTTWAPLGIMTPAVIVPEEDVIKAFRGWIIAYGSQAPE
jgi:uncharacterized protein YdeI (BOF family)